jgi:hypothetical protein
MASGASTTYDAVPAHRGEFLELLGKAKAHYESLGADTRVRTAFVAGPNSGIVLVQNWFEDDVKRGEWIDRVLETAGDSPLVAALRSADPPATVRGRTLTRAVPAGSPAPDNSAVQATFRYQVTPGQRPIAQAAGDEADKIAQGFGAATSRVALTHAGPNGGVVVRTIGADSFAALGAIEEKIQAEGPGAWEAAIGSGAITVVGRTVSRRLDV